MTTAPPPQENAGLTSLVETIVAPASAFDRLAEKQTWGWAFIASSLLMAVGALASGPVTRHVTQLMLEKQIATAPNPAVASQLAGIAAFSMKVAHIAWLFSPPVLLVIVLFATVILLIANAAFGGKATFKQLWCATMNVSIVFAIGTLLGSILIALRGPDAFAGVPDPARISILLRSPISLAAIVPTSNVKLLTALAAITPFSLWALWLNALVMQRIAKMAPARAWIAGVANLLLPLIFLTAFARPTPVPTTGTAPTTSASASP